MKTILLFLGAISLFSCDSDEAAPTSDAGQMDVIQTDDVDKSYLSDGSVIRDLGSDVSVSPDLLTEEDLSNDEDLSAEVAYGFVAQGHVGRLTYTCDGENWLWNQSNDDDLRCYDDATGNIDCDHGSGAANGLTHDSEYVFATFGWGQPGGIFRSTTGENWEEVLTGTTFGGLAAGNGVVLAGSVRPQISVDNGTTWTESNNPGFQGYNVRATAFAAGVFILIAQEGGGGVPEVRISEDGQTWAAPTSIPAECGSSIRGIVGNQTQIVMHSAQSICQSDDSGANWSVTRSGDDMGQGMVHNGTNFEVWDRQNKWSSADGKTWTSETMPTQINIGKVAFGNGTYVAINGGWQQWYEKQTAWYSTDGLTWIDTSQFTKSHSIRALIYAPLKECEK